MTMKIKALLAGCILITGMYNNAAAQNTTQAYNLKTCIDVAQANNIPVKQNGLQVETAAINYSSAKFSRLPNVSAGVNYGINNGRSIDPFTNGYINQQLSSSNANLSASVPIFKGFQTQRNIEQTSLSYEAAKQEYQQEKDNLTLSVILAFLQVLNNEDVLDLTTKQAGVTQKQVERLTEMNVNGAIAPATLSDMQGQYATDQLSIVTAANSLEISKLNLSQLMNIPYSKDMQVSREGVDTTVAMYAATSDQIYATALDKLSMVKAADLRVKAANKSTQIARSGLYPTLSLSGQLSSNYSSATRSATAISSTNVATSDYVVVNGSNSPVYTKQTSYNYSKIGYFDQYKNNFGSFIGLNLQVPIFAGLQTRHRIALAKVQEKNTSFIAENTRIQLQQSIEQAYLNTSTAFNKYKLLGDQVKAFEESFRSAEVRFNLGAINSVDYLIVKNNLDRANVNFTIARYEYLLRTKVLDFYQGILK